MAVKLKGIDVSKYQGNIDFNKVKASGVEFVIIRAGYGKHAKQKDPKFETYYAAAKAAGLSVGAYWYSYALTSADAIKEAEACNECIKGKKFEYPIFLDFEDNTQNKASIANAVIPSFISKLESYGWFVGLYSYYSMLKYTIPSALQKKYTMWVAHVTSSTSYTGHVMWQYSFKGKVPGISVDVDLDYSYVDYKTLMPTYGKNGFTKTDSSTTTTDTTNTDTTESPVTENTSVTGKLKTGDKVTLNNVKLYGSSKSKEASSTKSGDYYIYSNEVINGRYRITNSSNNVGKTPAGNYVTGWVDATDVETTTTDTTTDNSSTSTTTTEKTITTGSKVTLNNAKLYASSNSKEASSTKSGDYYIYSDKVINGRYRITNSSNNVGKTPAGTYVTGWVDESSIK